jgi:NAD(P)-dependent dehydrogenase (short-subunit alcohol dehydrogenase family)
MMVAGSSHVVFRTSSLAFLAGHPYAGDVIPHLASKGALISPAQAAYGDLARFGIGVTLFAPDYTATGLSAAVHDVGSPRGGGRAVIAQAAQMPEHAGEVLMRAVDAGDFLASATLRVDELLALQAASRRGPRVLMVAYDRSP